MESLTVREARRLALARAGLLHPERTGLPRRAGGGKRARLAALEVIRRFGYLQLDTVSIAGARSHAIVLMSRLEGFVPALAEELLQPGEPLFEYWAHETSWIPLELYPAFEFRRREFQIHPWWGDQVAKHPEVAQAVRSRIRQGGPLRSAELGGGGSGGWWKLKAAKLVALTLWSSGELAIRERRHFQRTYDLAERVIPEEFRARPLPQPEALEVLLLKALDGHGWATTGTLSATWRLVNRRKEVESVLARLQEQGRITACELAGADGGRVAGWIRPQDRELAAQLDRARPRSDRGVLLSPFDPLLWDRARVGQLFQFDQVLEVYKPKPKRIYGYYCLPVLAGDRLVARIDLKAEKRKGRLRVLSCRFEGTGNAHPSSPADMQAVRSGLDRFAEALRLDTVSRP